jgi:hypothetical protein
MCKDSTLFLAKNNFFDKPNDQSQTCLNFGMARKSRCKSTQNVMRAIRKMEPAWVNIAGSNFRLGSYKDANGQLRPCYQLTKTECLYIATKFNDEARARLVLRWQELIFLNFVSLCF